jgi:hypothetical protein
VGVLLPSSTDLVAQTYDDRHCRIQNQTLENAFTKAVFESRFSRPEPLIQNVPVDFTATLIYGVDKPSQGQQFDIACQNEAKLDFDPKQWDVDPLTSARQDLNDESIAMPGDRRALVWRWAVTPRDAGTLSFKVDIQPIISSRNGEQRYQHRNPPVHVAVRVHPNAQAFADLRAQARKLDVEIPEMTAGRTSEVRARLPLLGHGDVVTADLELTQGENSVQTSITPLEQTTKDDEVVGTWSVKPTEPGVVNLRFAVNLSAQVGDQALQQQVPIPVSAIVERSLWARFSGLVALLGALFAAVLGGLAIWKQLGNKGEAGDQEQGRPAGKSAHKQSGQKSKQGKQQGKKKKKRRSEKPTSRKPKADGAAG